MNMIGHPEIDDDPRDWQIPPTFKGKKARAEWIGRHAFKFQPGKWHLHARWLKGEIVWVLSSRGSPLCKQEGRCRIVEIKDAIQAS